MNRLTYLSVGDALRAPHYCAAPGVKKNDLIQRLGVLEDEIQNWNNCDGCRYLNAGDGTPDVCNACCRNYEEDRYEGVHR